MASIGSGYDLSSSTYSPDGRIFQVEYAAKAVETSGTTIGLKCKDGVVLGMEKVLHSKLLKRGANRRIMSADLHIGIAAAGLIADCRQLGNRARVEASNYRELFDTDISGKEFAERLGMYLHAYTCYSSVRPFGITAITGLVDKDGPHLYMFEPSGVYWGYKCCATGKGKAFAKTEIEKLDLSTMSCREAVLELVRILHQCHEDAKDTKDFEVEISWICPESNNQHCLIPAELLREAEEKAKAVILASMDYD